MELYGALDMSEPKIFIRKTLPQDAADIQQIHVAAYKTSYRGFLPDDVLDALKIEDEKIERTKIYVTQIESYVAIYQQRVIGFAHLALPQDKVLEIQALYVHPQFQRLGAGLALVEFVCASHKACGFSKCEIWTLKNGSAVPFYHKLGFEPELGVQEKSWKYGLPIIKLCKQL